MRWPTTRDRAERLLTLEELNSLLDWQAKSTTAGTARRSRLDRWVRDVPRRGGRFPPRNGRPSRMQTPKYGAGRQFQLRASPTPERLGSLPTEKVHVRFLRGDIWRVIVLLEGRVFCLAHPVEGRLWKGLQGYAECAQYRRELRDSMARVDESQGLLAAARETGLVDAGEASQAVATLDRLRTAKARERVAVADRAKRTAAPALRENQDQLAEVTYLHPPGRAELRGTLDEADKRQQRAAETVDALLDADLTPGTRGAKAAIDEWL